MIKKLMSLGMVVALAAGVMAASAGEADARRGRGVAVGVAAGVIGLGILGAAAAANAGPRYYGGPAYYGYGGPRYYGCYTRRQCWYDRWGDPVCRRVRVCD